ncbi:MAG: HAD family hydrolase [Deltaproteobacteria bacterium]|nr:HAD family hydrolase [Deltaproteobacteria bacterium]
MTDSGQGAVAAFFDVDGTLLRVHSGSLYVADLRRRGLLSRGDHLRFLWLALTYRIGFLSMKRLGEVAGRFLRGRPESEVLEHCRQWYEADVRAQVSDSVVALLRGHVGQGHTVALLTAGTRYVSDLLAADLGIEHVIATELEIKDGIFTGGAHLPLCYGSGKIARAEMFARAHGLDLDRSYFYSDSISDLPMLLRVGEPRVVRPDARLRRQARQRGWGILE